MIELDITLREEKRTVKEYRKGPPPLRVSMWVAETAQYPTVTGETPRDCLDNLSTMLEQGVSGESEYDREDDDE